MEAGPEGSLTFEVRSILSASPDDLVARHGRAYACAGGTCRGPNIARPQRVLAYLLPTEITWGGGKHQAS